MNRYIANTCKAIIALIIATVSVSCASHSSEVENVDLVGLWKCSNDSKWDICFTPKGHFFDYNKLYNVYKIEGDTLFYKESDTKDKWNSDSFEMVSDDVFILDGYAVFIRKK